MIFYKICLSLIVAVKMLQLKKSNGNASKLTSSNREETTRFRQLEKNCYQELYNFIKTKANDLGCSTWSLMSVTSISMMSTKMPQTEEEMLQIVGVTDANYKKCGGKALLEITERYRREKEGKD